MIHSVSTYLQSITRKYLKAFLSDSYILNEEILNDFPKEIRQSFIHTFSTDKKNTPGALGKPIDVRFTYVPKDLSPDATVLIQEKGGQEQNSDNQSIGMNMGMTDEKDANVYKESSLDHYDPKKNLAYLQVSHPINKIISIDKYDGRKKVIGNRIYLLGSYSAFLAKNNNVPNEKCVITYNSKSSNVNKYNKHNVYDLEGYDATESYTLDLIAPNIDTIRCLSALMKAIFIAMRLQAVQENTRFHLPKITEQGVDQLHTINNSTHSVFGNKYFYKRFTLNYLVTYTLPQKVGFYINHIVSNPKFKGISEHS